MSKNPVIKIFTGVGSVLIRLRWLNGSQVISVFSVYHENIFFNKKVTHNWNKYEICKKKQYYYFLRINNMRFSQLLFREMINCSKFDSSKKLVDTKISKKWKLAENQKSSAVRVFRAVSLFDKNNINCSNCNWSTKVL